MSAPQLTAFAAGQHHQDCFLHVHAVFSLIEDD
jgi:hypothetical protein